MCIAASNTAGIIRILLKLPGTLCGFGAIGYELAVEALAHLIEIH